MAYIGEIAAVGAAIAWAVATWIYSQFSHRFSALQLNIVKGLIASVMMVLFLPMSMPIMNAPSTTHIFVLAVSGVIGIAVGDSAYFASLKRIGPNKTLLLESLAPPLSGVLAVVMLGSLLPIQSWLGVLITTIAVTSVVVQPEPSGRLSWSGVGFGLLASVCQATGVVISHYALVAGDISPLLGALIRLSIGVAAVILVIGFVESQPFRNMKIYIRDLGNYGFLWLLLAIFIGTFMALWLQQVALKHANPAVAQTLIATSPLFMLAIHAIKGDKLNKKSLIGTLIAVGGISLFFVR